MQNSVIQSRVAPELRMAADELFRSMGLSTSDAIRLFLQQSVNVGGLPFQPAAPRRPNAATRAALQELMDGHGKTYASSDEFLDDMGI